MKNKINFAEDKSFRRGELYLADMRGLSNQGKTEMLVVVMQNDPGFLSVPTVSVFPWPVKILEAEQQEKRPCSCGETVLVNGDPMVLDKKRIRKYEGTLKDSQTLDKPKHSNAILFLRGLAGLALLFSPSLSLC